MKIKCLIWDMDDTLWQGTLSEDWNVVFCEEKREIVKKIDKLGILQSIASRNNLDQVMEKLEELGIQEYFLYPQCHWSSKVDSIKRIADKLNIGLDSIAYIDDNPFELAEIQYFLPKVRTYNADDCNKLLDLDEFINESVTRESSMRRQMMISRWMREEAEDSFKGSRGDFLKECRMELMVRSGKIDDLERVYELISRTNQMNNMLDRINRDTVIDFIDSQDKAVYVAELTDRFGYHGIVGACLFEIKENSTFIKLFCISCRVEGRGIGTAFLGTAISELADSSSYISEVYCDYLYKKRNRPALMLLQIVGFKLFTKLEEKSTYILRLPMEKVSFDWLNIEVK